MLVAYLDETYLKNTEHSVLALVLPADEIKTLETRLNAVVSQAQNACTQLKDDIELHGYLLANGKDDWKPLTAPRQRIGIYSNAIDAIVSIPGAAMLRGGVDLQKHAPSDPHEWALKIVLEKINKHALTNNQNVVGICDDVGNKTVYQGSFSKMRKHGTGGRWPSKLEQFADGLHFTPSCHSRLIQAVDLLCYLYRREKMVPFHDRRAQQANTQMWDKTAQIRSLGWERTWA